MLAMSRANCLNGPAPLHFHSLGQNQSTRKNSVNINSPEQGSEVTAGQSEWEKVKKKWEVAGRADQVLSKALNNLDSKYLLVPTPNLVLY